MRDAGLHLDELKIKAIGVSPDSELVQKEFDRKFNLGFTLLSDKEHKAAQDYGVWQEKNLYGKTSWGIIRSSFLIGEEGEIVGAWYKIKPEDTVPKAIEAMG